MSAATRRIFALGGVVFVAAAVSAAALAFWTAGGSGSAQAAAAGLGAPGAPEVSVAGGSATLHWTAASAPGAGAVAYRVERLDTSGSLWTDACGTSSAAPITAVDCSDVPGDGTFVWRVTAIFHSWTATGAESSAASLDVTPPTGSVTAPLGSAAVRGTVTVTSDSADATSGVASAQFQTSPAGAAAWTDLGGGDTTPPYSAAWNTTAFGDGAYDLRVITTDNLGNSFTSASTTDVVVDNTAPAVALALASGATGAYLNASAGRIYFKANAAGGYRLVATVSDAGSGGASATFPVLGTAGWAHPAETDTTPVNGPYTSGAFTWSSGASTPGTYTVSAADAAGNGATSALAFTADSTPPSGNVTAPAATTNVRGTVSVTSGSADAGSGVASAQFQISPAGAGSWSSLGPADTVTPFAASWDTAAFADGLYDLRVATTDNVGNVFTSPTIANVRVDNTTPSGSLTAPAASAIIKGTYVLTSDSADGGSGVANAVFQRSPAGASTWTNVAAADTTAPFTASWNTTTPGDGLYDLRVVTTDKAGNAFTSAQVTNVRVDNTLPTGAVTTPAAPANVRGLVTVTASSADAGSGVASVQIQSTPHGLATWTTIAPSPAVPPYSISWDTTAYADGLYDLRVLTTDNAGNLATSATIANVRVDNTAPTGSITAPLSGANIKGTFSVTSDSADAGSAVASALFQRSPAGADTWTNVATADTSSPFAASWATTTPGDGVYDLRVITTDKAGNAFTSALATGVRVDNTAPVVATAVASGAVGAFQSGTRIYFKSNAAGSFSLVTTVSDAGSGAASATFPALTATNWTTHAAETDTTPVNGPYTSTSFAWATGATAPAAYTVTGADAAGNTAPNAFTFTADAVAPTGAVTAPAAAANVRGSVNVASSSADAASGVASAQFQVSPAGAGTWSNLGAADTVTPYAASWDTTAFSDGLYDLRVTTTDNVGNVFTSPAIANVRVDNTPPSGSLTAPAANAFVSASIAVSANSADGGSGVASALFQASPHNAGIWSNLAAADTTSPYSVTWNTTTFSNGQYDLRVVTSDRSGNTFTSAPLLVEVQNGAPTATSVQLLDDGGVPGRAEQGDQIVVTFSQSLRVSTLCSLWSGDFSDQLLATPGDVTVTLADGGVANDTLAIASTACAFHFGAINLGATGYATGGNVTFAGSTAADASSVAWDAATHTLTATLGARGGAGTPGSVASSAGIYTPDSALKSGFGTTITGTCSTGTTTLF